MTLLILAVMRVWKAVTAVSWRCRLGDHADVLAAGAVVCRDCGKARAPRPNAAARAWAEDNYLDYR